MSNPTPYIQLIGEQNVPGTRGTAGPRWSRNAAFIHLCCLRIFYLISSWELRAGERGEGGGRAEARDPHHTTPMTDASFSSHISPVSLIAPDFPHCLSQLSNIGNSSALTHFSTLFIGCYTISTGELDPAIKCTPVFTSYTPL